MSDMQHDDRDLDAAEYVLGTLSPEAARDMAERMAREPELARAVADWETRLARFGEDLAPVEPPAHVWQAISDDLSMTRPTGRGDIREAANDSALRRWRIAAVAASTAACALVSTLTVRPRAPRQSWEMLGLVFADAMPVLLLAVQLNST